VDTSFLPVDKMHGYSHQCSDTTGQPYLRGAVSREGGGGTRAPSVKADAAPSTRVLGYLIAALCAGDHNDGEPSGGKGPSVVAIMLHRDRVIRAPPPAL